MDEERPRKRRTTTFIRSARATRILERLPGGFGCDEIGREEARLAISHWKITIFR